MGQIKYIFLVFIGILFSMGIFSQEGNPLRIELNANLNMENYHLVPCGGKGVLVFFESNDKGSNLDTRIWHFALYDKNFKQQWLADTALNEGAKFNGYKHNNGETYLFFVNSERRKSPHNFHILKVNFGSADFNVLDVNVSDGSSMLNAFFNNNKLIVGFNNSSFQPDIAVIDLKDAATRIIHPQLEGLNILQQIIMDEDNQEILMVIENYLGKKQHALNILRMNLSGGILKTYTINPALSGKVINAARIASSEGDTLLICGTYSNEVSKLSENTDESGAESAGYFITKFVGTEEVLINYYNFLEFEEMFRSLNSKTIADLRVKAEKQKSKGKEYSLDYTLILHDIVELDSNYVLLTEAYYPEYRTVTNMYYDYYGRPIPQTYTVFDGYKYISTIAASFSDEGELNWDNGLEFLNIMTFNLAKYGESYISNNEMALFYANENKVYYKIIGEKEDPQAAQKMAIAKMYKGDKLMEDLGSKIIHWYDNYFICYGYQQIKNNRVSGGKRTIFFFNKIAFN